MEQVDKRKSYLKLLVILAVIFILILAGYAIYQSVVFRLTGTNPSVNNVATVSPFFKVSFNKNLDSTDLSVTSRPNIIDSYQVTGSDINILLNEPLSSSQSYSITVSGIISTAGKHLSNKVFSFTPKYIASNLLPQDQQQALLKIQERYNQIVLGNGLVKLLPFTSGGNEFEVSYSVSYSNQIPKLTIVITSSTEQGQSDALNWIKLVGFNPSNYTIQYVNGVVN